MPNKKNQKQNSDIQINLKKSGLVEFTKRPVPTDEEVKQFEKQISLIDNTEEKNFNNKNNEEIKKNLNEIYCDDKGNTIDVKKIKILKKHGFFFWFFTFIFFLVGITSVSYFVYNYYFIIPSSKNETLSFVVEGKNEIVAGEEFFYTLKYNNDSKIGISNAKIEINYPDNFVFLDSYPKSNNKTNTIWDINKISPGSNSSIKIKGYLIGAKNESGILTANMTYTPENFSSEFKKNTTFTTRINDIGINFDIDYIPTALVGEKNEILIVINAKENNYINNFRLSASQPENMKFLNSTESLFTLNKKNKDKIIEFNSIRPGVWQIKNIVNEEKILPIEFIFNNKDKNVAEIELKFEKIINDNNIIFYNKILNFEIMKSDLNLTMIINGSQKNKGVNFGEQLNYSIVYINKGEITMENVVIMAVLDSDFLDWTTLNEQLGATEKGNTIIWDKTNIENLAELKPNEEGMINFSINTAKISVINPDSEYNIKSFAQFNINNDENEKNNNSNDNKSNTIINEINSDLKLIEQIKYFNDDNFTVGNGPLPPQIGKKTSFKVYWEITNNLHELENTKVETILPEYISWDNKNKTNTGSIKYDNDTRKVIWDIGRLPINIFKADAQFNISVIPKENDKNKIMILIPESKISAVDSKTKAKIQKIMEAKTTKLEDDEYATKINNGIIVE